MASTSESRQRTQTTILEGGIPHRAAQVLELVGGTADQSLPSTSVDPDATIAILPLEESPALPEARDINDPADWPIDVRGMPHHRPRTEIDFTTRPMGANTGEFIFLTFMFSGVQTLGYANTAWRKTIGRFTDRWMKNEIGGNW